MEKKYDVTALGELLIDFTENGLSAQGNVIMEANPGGAPCNVLAMLSKLGHKTGFIGKVGDDSFGKRLREVVSEVGIDVSGLVTDENVHTTLAFVHTAPDGDRSFSFYRNPGADMMLGAGEINEDMIRQSKIFHFGTLSMTDEICEEATKKAVGIARGQGCLISFDPNLREKLWRSLDEAKEKTLWGLGKCDILKISDNEIIWLTGKNDFDEAVEELRREYHEISLILLSCGKDGSRAYMGGSSASVPAFALKETIETTGAGDTFFGAVLNYILEKGCENGRMPQLSDSELEEMLIFANAAAALITTKKGALRVMPSREEILKLMSDNGF